MIWKAIKFVVGYSEVAFTFRRLVLTAFAVVHRHLGVIRRWPDAGVGVTLLNRVPPVNGMLVSGPRGIRQAQQTSFVSSTRARFDVQKRPIDFLGGLGNVKLTSPFSMSCFARLTFLTVAGKSSIANRM